MPENRTFGLVLGGIVIAVFIFWMAGIVANFWSGLGIATLLLLFFATSLLTAYKKTSVAVLIVTLVLLFIQHTTPESVSNAVVTRAIDTAVRTSVTVGKPIAEIEKARLVVCKKDLDAAVNRHLTPRKLELDNMNTGIRSFDAARRDTLIVEIKDWEGKIKRAAADCMEGLAYQTPSLPASGISGIIIWILPSTRAGVTLLFVLLALSGWGFYRATEKARLTRWVGGPLLILAVLYALYSFFNVGLDKKVEEGVTRFWNASTKESPAPSPSPPPAPEPKEEKTIATKKWRREKVTEADIKKASSWSLPNVPAVRFSMKRGQTFRWPAGGSGMCAAVVLEMGEFKLPTGHRSTFVSNCNNREIEIECISAQCRGFAGYAFRGPNGLETLALK